MRITSSLIRRGFLNLYRHSFDIPEYFSFFYFWMMTVDEVYRHFVTRLKAIYDERESKNIADWVFESIAGIKRLRRVTEKDEVLVNPTGNQLQLALQQLLEHRPVQYVLGEAWFYKMKLKVNEHVLIPRPETEELVEWVVEEVRIERALYPPPTVLDIGTGCGCIAIALKKELPSAAVRAVDVSEGALILARQNASEQNAAIVFVQLDFLDEASWDQFPSFDIIISNPPYIPETQKMNMAKHVVDYEPHIALFVTDDDPFIFYKKIAAFAHTHLKERGSIFVEVHEAYAISVQQIFVEKELKTEIKKDLFGRERMIRAYKG